MELKICHLYPDVLNLYGDTGNLVCLQKRLQWRGIEAQVTALPMGETADFTQFDLFLIGGGQDFEQTVLLEDLHRGKDKQIISAVEDGKVFLAICGGYQMLGKYYKTHTGEQCDFIGALDLYTVGSEPRMIGNYMYECARENGGSVVVGFENHGGRTFLGPGVRPLGRVITGYGNNGQDGTEGARYQNVFGTYSHGPLLPKNPAFADMLLETALARKYGRAELAPLDDTMELRAHDYMEKRLRAPVDPEARSKYR